MTTPDPVGWLRQQIESQKALAVEACHGGEGRWWRRLEKSADGTSCPAGALYDGEPEVDDPEHDIFLADVVVYDEGRPSDAQFAHIAGNDPRDTIARCEAELAILDECELLRMVGIAFPGEAGPESAEKISRLVATTYRRRPGYTEHWGSGD